MAIVDTTVVNMRLSTYDVAIDRSSPFGNPYHLKHEGERGTVLHQYREYFLARVERDPEFRAKVLTLRGKRLGCWCAPKLCHGMIIVEWLEANTEQRKPHPHAQCSLCGSELREGLDDGDKLLGVWTCARCGTITYDRLDR